MLSPPRRSDPDGLYTRLGVEPAATAAQIAKAFRARARVLHPDVPRTGNAEAFVKLKQAYDTLSNPVQRAAYDRRAEQPEPVTFPDYVAPDDDEPIEIHPARPSPPPSLDIPIAPRLPRLSGVPMVVWIGMSAVLALGVIEMAMHLRTPPKPAGTAIRPNAPTVTPLSDNAHRTVLYGPPPIHLPGETNVYVTPANEPAVLWRRQADQLYHLADLPAFSTGHVIRLDRLAGLAEVMISETASGFVVISRLAPGDNRAARRAYCSYNAGPALQDGELLEKRADGGGTFSVDNQAQEPAVVKLRDSHGQVTISVFLAPGSQSDVPGVPAGSYTPEFSVGELWSRACNGFTAPVRTVRLAPVQLAPVQLAQTPRITVTADSEAAGWQALTEQDFERD